LAEKVNIPPGLEMRPALSDEMLDNWFTYHAPEGDQQFAYNRIREAGRKLAFVIRDCCPPGADTTAAIRKVREAIMTANAGVACGGR
jgi:hypothetical protein